ncbi:reverse transcriptase domain-containing protein [Tanacetum coccineum]
MHVCKDRCWFKTYESLNDGYILHIGNESTALAWTWMCKFSSGKIFSLKQIRNEGLCTAQDYYSEEYEEEREMEPRPTQVGETNPALRTRSPRARRQRGRVVEFEDAPDRDGSRVEKESKGGRPSERRVEDNENRRVNLRPLLATHLGRNENGQPLHFTLTSAYGAYGGHQPSNNSGWNLHPNGTHLLYNALPFTHNSLQPSNGLAPMSNYGPTPNGFTYPSGGLRNSYPFYTQPINPLPNAPAYPNYGLTGLFVDSTESVTPFVCWIEDYPLPDGLKMPSFMGSYDGKGDLNNYLHLFEGVIHDMLHILGLHKEQRIYGFVHGLKTRSLVEFLSTDLPATYKGLMEKTYTWIEAKEVATNGATNGHQKGFVRFGKGPSRTYTKEGRRIETDYLRTRGLITDSLLTYLKILGEILAAKKAAKGFEHHPRMKKGDKDIVPAKAPILMISRESPISKKNSLEEPIDGIGEITFPPVLGSKNSSDSVIIKVRISERQVNRAYMDSGNTCEVIYEHCFLKLNSSIRALRVDSKISLVGFSGEHSWPLGEVPLEVTIGENPYTKTETLNFIIVRSDSTHNLLLGRTAIQRMGIVVFTIHATIKFNTNKVKEGQKKIKETILEAKRDVLSCVDAKEKVVGLEDLRGLHGQNKACPKDYYPLPEIDWKVESLSGFQLKCFLDTYKGYHQIQMAEEDEDKTTFFTGKGLFCYREMAFDLKNAGATCQRLVDKLNPKKCSFGVEEGPFLGHLITKQGIRANLSKIKAVTDLESPRTLKDVQSHKGKLVALSRFLSKGAEKSLSFFQALKSCIDKKTIRWTTDAEEAF